MTTAGITTHRLRTADYERCQLTVSLQMVSVIVKKVPSISGFKRGFAMAGRSIIECGLMYCLAYLVM